MRTFHGTFPVEPGIGIFVPNSSIRRHSLKANDFPATPVIYLLARHNKGGRRYFLQTEHRRGREEADQSGFHLFAPAATKPGDLLVIEWSNKTCAATRLATAQEIEATKPPTAEYNEGGW
ncbi:MAG: hypothetical protein HY979_00110 [Candidatus Magasanikbacteria bacterium]|nr:hypothetical protein [Candidatus Magasanikbacteria bacterium]